jgi:predicted double-glycine peptidase
MRMSKPVALIVELARARRQRIWIPVGAGGLALTAALTIVLVSLQPAEADTRGVKPVRTLIELQRDKVVRQQWDLSCGAATLATILAYQHGDPIPERAIAEAMLKRTDSELVQAHMGFSLLDLKRFAESRGYVATGYADLTLADLVEFRPAIVPIKLTTFDHFVVFRGRQGDRVLLADPSYGNRIMHVVTFEKVWRDNIAFIVQRRDGATPPDRLSARPDDFRVPSVTIVRAMVLN